MNPHQPLMDQLYREEILHARKQTPQQRLRATFEITDFSLGIMRGGVRHQFPGASEEELLQLGRKRLAIIRRVQDWHVFENPGR